MSWIQLLEMLSETDGIVLARLISLGYCPQSVWQQVLSTLFFDYDYDDEDEKQSNLLVRAAIFVGFRPFRSCLGGCLIFVGWVEVRNPTLSMGLYPTYPKMYFSFRH
jgi:hypothetical protein